MTFKDLLADDVEAVFLSDFAEEVEFLGEQRMAVVERHGVRWPDDGDDRRGVALETVTVHLSRNAAPSVLTPGLAVSFEGQRWHVLGAEPEMGLLIVTLYREVAA